MATIEEQIREEVVRRKEFMEDFERIRLNREQHEKEATRLQTAKEWLFNEQRKVLPHAESVKVESSTQDYYMKMDTVAVDDAEFEILKREYER